MDKKQILVDHISKKNEGQKAALINALEFLNSNETRMLEECIDFLEKQGFGLEYIASCYNLISDDTLTEQAYFLEHGRYRYSSYTEVADSVYGNKEYMQMYMYGLMLTEFFWKNHIMMTRWFEEKLPKDRRGDYLEIGPGHGYHLMKAMRNCLFDSYEAVDISATSIGLTSAIISHFRPDALPNLRLREADFLKHDFKKKYDAVVMGEVLEHVEQPKAFIERIAQVAKPDAFIYLTTAINAPSIDHIYLFDSPQAVEDVVKSAGLAVKDVLLVPYKGISLERSLKHRLPISITLVIG